jgi:hypothetical protein
MAVLHNFKNKTYIMYSLRVTPLPMKNSECAPVSKCVLNRAIWNTKVPTVN